MISLWQVIGLASLGSIVSLAGGFILIAKKSLASRIALLAAPFAAGSLLAAAFYDLLPEALADNPSGTVLNWALVGMIGFFLLERALNWFHHHHEHGKKLPQPTVWLVVLGDCLHNLIDGAVIGGSFLISPQLGTVTTMAVAAHEVPQEVGDFGLLLKLGLSRRKVVLLNLLSALITIIAAGLVFSLGSAEGLPMGALLGLTAGLFIYIAAADIIPTIHQSGKHQRLANFENLMLLLGVLSVVAVVSALE
jgi:zinc and cadmium transporter